MDKHRKKIRNDIIMLAGLLLLGIILFIAVNASQTEGAMVDVIVDGEVVQTFPLDEDREVDLEYNGYNLLIISGGTARIDNADCPDQLCVDYRPISKSGETIVCLPHKLIIKIRGGEESDLDAVVQ